MIVGVWGQEQTEWTVGVRRDALPCSHHGPQLPPCTVLFSKEPAALAGSITEGLSKLTCNWPYDGNAGVEACTANPPNPTTQLSLEQLRLASGYCLASECQCASSTAAFHRHLSKLTVIISSRHLKELDTYRRKVNAGLSTFPQFLSSEVSYTLSSLRRTSRPKNSGYI